MERDSRRIDRLEQCSAFPWMSKEKYLIDTPATQNKQEANFRWSRWELRIKPFPFFSSTKEKYLIDTPTKQHKQEANFRWSRWELRIKPFPFFSSTGNLQQPSHVPLPPPPPPLNPLVPPLASVEASSSLPYRPDFIGSWVALGASF